MVSSMRASDELLDELYDRKNRDETYEDYLWRLLDRVDDLEELESDGCRADDGGRSVLEDRDSTPGPVDSLDRVPERDETDTGESDEPDSGLDESADDELTAAIEGENPYEDVNEKAIAALRETDKRVNRSAILELVADDLDIKPESWWNRHGKDALEDAGADYVRNRGWGFDE